MRNLGEWVVCRLEWVHGRGLRAREDEVKERDGERVIQRRADEKRDLQRVTVWCWRERERGLGGVLCRDVNRSINIQYQKIRRTHQLEFSLATRRDAHGLDTLFLRLGVEEAQERLVRLHAIARLVNDLESELEGVLRR